MLIFGRRAAEQDAVRRRVREIGKDTRRTYNLAAEELSEPLFDRLIKPALKTISQLVRRIFPTRSDKEKKSNAQLRRQLTQAGWSISPEDYTVVQMLVMLSCGLLGILLGVLLEADLLRLAAMFVIGVFGAYTILRFLLVSRGTARRRIFEEQLPDVIDLLCVSVEAGLGFEQALQHITENMDGPLVDELAVTCREMSMGRTRREAMLLLAERCDIPDMHSFASALVQAGQLGIPIKNVLHAQSEAIRRARKSKVQEKAAKVSIKILIPMLFFIFPVLFIILLGPAAMNIMRSFA